MAKKTYPNDAYLAQQIDMQIEISKKESYPRSEMTLNDAMNKAELIGNETLKSNYEALISDLQSDLSSQQS